MFYGRGAGKEATASAVVADIMDCAKHLEARKYLSWEDGSDNYVANDIDEKGKLFVRLKSDNYDELVTRFHSVFGTEGFQYVKNQFTKEITFITEEDFESNINKKLAEFKDCQVKTIHTML